MPELPEVETMRRGILGAVGGTVTAVERIRCRKKPIAIKPGIRSISNRIVGKSVHGVSRIGKRVVIEIGDNEIEEHLIFEPRMTGLVLVASPPTREHLRFRIGLGQCDLDEICYWDRRGLGNVTLFNVEELRQRFHSGFIGPDALAISFDQFRERFGALNRPIKVALLDQKLVAGVGNLYASELLHLAKIHPAKKCSAIAKTEYQKIYDQMREVLETAIRYEGSTLSDGTYRNALNKQGGYQNQHLVYDRAGQTCQQCGKENIERIVQAQRATFFCQRCQKSK